MTASGRSFSIAAKAVSNSSLLLILIALIVVPVASPPSWICSRKGLEKASVAFASRFGGDASQPSDISARPRKARDQPQTDGVSGLGHHDRDFPRRLLCRHSGGREPSDDDIDLETNQLSCQFGKPVDLSFRRPKLKSNVLPLDIPQIAWSLPKFPPEFFRADIANNQRADGRHLRLLRARGERPRRRAAEQRDKLAPPHSITSSASNCIELGTESPSAFAAFRLITSSNL